MAIHFDITLIATDKEDRQFEYNYDGGDDPRNFAHLIAELHSIYSNLVNKGICKVYTIICFEERIVE
jgi:hypothetical protein